MRRNAYGRVSNEARDERLLLLLLLLLLLMHFNDMRRGSTIEKIESKSASTVGKSAEKKRVTHDLNLSRKL
jgi:hypothetical protein